MFTNDIVLTGDAASTQTYSLQSINAGKSIRGDALLGAALPRTMTIGHTESSKAGKITDRHLVRLDLVKADAITGLTVNIGVYLVIEMPRTTATVAQVKDMVTQLKNFLVPGAVQQLLNNEP